MNGTSTLTLNCIDLNKRSGFCRECPNTKWRVAPSRLSQLDQALCQVELLPPDALPRHENRQLRDAEFTLGSSPQADFVIDQNAQAFLRADAERRAPPRATVYLPDVAPMELAPIHMRIRYTNGVWIGSGPASSQQDLYPIKVGGEAVNDAGWIVVDHQVIKIGTWLKIEADITQDPLEQQTILEHKAAELEHKISAQKHRLIHVVSLPGCGMTDIFKRVVARLNQDPTPAETRAVGAPHAPQSQSQAVPHVISLLLSDVKDGRETIGRLVLRKYKERFPKVTSLSSINNCIIIIDHVDYYLASASEEEREQRVNQIKALVRELKVGERYPPKNPNAIVIGRGQWLDLAVPEMIIIPPPAAYTYPEAEIEQFLRHFSELTRYALYWLATYAHLPQGRSVTIEVPNKMEQRMLTGVGILDEQGNINARLQAVCRRLDVGQYQEGFRYTLEHRRNHRSALVMSDHEHVLDQDLLKVLKLLYEAPRPKRILHRNSILEKIPGLLPEELVDMLERAQTLTCPLGWPILYQPQPNYLGMRTDIHIDNIDDFLT